MDKIHIDEIENAFMSGQRGKIYHSIIGEAEKVIIEKALEPSHGNQIEAARNLGVNRNTLRSKIKKLNITVERFKI